MPPSPFGGHWLETFAELEVGNLDAVILLEPVFRAGLGW